MGLMEEASAWLADMCGEHLASRVLWRPSGGAGREVPAVFARTVFRAEDGYGLTTETESRDFIVRTADMPEEPRRGEGISSLRSRATRQGCLPVQYKIL